jgi:branched-chain amino acid transport system permease protein
VNARYWKWAGLGAAGLFLLLAPLFLSGYWVRLLTSIFMYAVMAEGWNIIAGYCGYPSFGNVVFFGLGAYTTCILMVELKMPFAVGLLAGAAVSSLYAMILGLPILRLRGHYFAVATLGLAEATRELVTNLENITKGTEGISMPIIPGSVEKIYSAFYYGMLGLMIVTILFTLWMSRHRIGYAFRAIRSDEDGARVMGINPTWYKTLAWTASAFFTGLAGGIYAYWTAFINPEGVFNVAITVKMLIMTFLGGPGTVLGPIFGAFIFEFLSELVWSHFVNVHAAFLGVIIILVVVFMPGGFMRLVEKRFSWRSIMTSLKESRI